MITFLLILCAVFMVGGFVAYNPLRRKMDGIIGVGGAYFILIGILMLFASIGQIAGTISGTSNVSALEIILGIAVAVAGLGYMVIVMLSRCQTQVFPQTPDAMVLLGGINDINLTGDYRFAKVNMTAILQQAAAIGLPVRFSFPPAEQTVLL